MAHVILFEHIKLRGGYGGSAREGEKRDAKPHGGTAPLRKVSRGSGIQ
jgi:hypothetical protein